MNGKSQRLIAAVLAVFFLLAVLPYFINLLLDQQKAGKLQVRVLGPGGSIQQIPLEEYLVGVVAAEMPAEFELEALKAQSVAARTYALKKIEQNGGNSFDVDMTENTQVYHSGRQMLKKWGIIGYFKYKRKIAQAVEETRGQFLTYEGKKIEAVYFSSCGHKGTEKSGEVWSGDVAYLTNVASNETKPDRFVTQQTFDAATFYHLLGYSQTPARLGPDDLQIIDRTKAGRVKNLTVLGKVWKATEFRQKLQLPSTDFEWKIDGQTIQFTCYGKGHAVGMSQYGANDMAKGGKDYQEILRHYYPGTKIEKVN